MNRRLILIILLIPILLSGCKWSLRGLLQQWNQKNESPSSEKEVSSEDYEYSSVIAKKTKINGERLQEVYRVVFMKEPASKVLFGSLVDSMNQGASLEGIYNGLIHSADFRKLEFDEPASSARALRIFAEQMYLLEKELPSPTLYTRADTQPLPFIQTGEMQETPGEITYPGNAPSGKTAPPARPAGHFKLSATDLTISEQGITGIYRFFERSSVYTLKRVLGDLLLRVIALKRESSRQEFAGWYAKWVLQALSYGTPFGLELRDRKDEEFHLNWAVRMDDDLVRWEMLNRAHRLLNHAFRPAPERSPEAKD